MHHWKFDSKKKNLKTEQPTAYSTTRSVCILTDTNPFRSAITRNSCS